MRARGLPKAHPAPSLCLFCASRLLGEQLQPAVLASPHHRRLLNTTRPPHHPAASASAPRTEPANDNSNGDGWTLRAWDPNDSLTAAERAGRERRRQQRVEAEEADQKRAAARAGQYNHNIRPAGEPSRDGGLLRFHGQTAGNGQLQERHPPSSGQDPTSSSRNQRGQVASALRDVFSTDRGHLTSPFGSPEATTRRSTSPNTGTVGERPQISHKRKEESTSPPPQQWTLRRTQPIEISNDMIEQAFSDKDKRQKANVPSASPILIRRTGYTKRPTYGEVHRCGRCLEYGHFSRDCTGPLKRSCRLCGEVGHIAQDCPEPYGGWGRDLRRAEDPGSQHQVADDSRTPAIQQPARTVAPGPSPRQPVRTAVPATGPEHTNYTPRIHSPALANSPAYANNPPYTKDPSYTNKPSYTKSPPYTSNPPHTDVDATEERSSDRRAGRSKRGFEDADEELALPSRGDRRSRRSGREVVYDRNDDDGDEAAYLREQRAARKAARKAAQKAVKAAERQEAGATVALPEFISVSQLAQTLNVHYDPFVKRLEELGYDDVFPGKVLNAETSGMIAMEYNFDPVFEESAEKLEDEERDLRARPELEDKTLLPTRPPVVTIMGHVDHGKTTILDYLRQSSIAAGEAGGITQHIGAFSVPLSASEKTVTFLDTPGHAAFLAMRQRGANVTDIVVLVVAADDSVKPQTIESIRCAREARVPMLIAINKVDKPEADIQRVKQDLAANGVEIEDFGGDAQVVCVSGKTGQGMDALEEAAVTLSEILDHRAEVDGNVEGWVLEATTKKAGRVATVLVKRGTLRPGAVIVAGNTWARVRTLKNEAGQTVDEAAPGMPIEVDGWRDQPSAGDQVLQAASEQKAGDVVAYRLEKEDRARTAVDMEVINEARRLEQKKRLREKAEKEAKDKNSDVPADQKPVATKAEQESGQLTVPFLIKADVSGSAEAVSAYVPSLTSPLIAPQILHSGVGAVHESDIEYAAAAEGHIIAFNLPPDPEAKANAEAQGVRILENNIIYRVLDDVKAIMEERLPPVITQRVLGEAEISASFDIKMGGRKVLWIAGCKVRNGVVSRGSRARVMRGSVKVYDGAVSSLKNVKKDVQEMRKGSECGMGFTDWQDFQVGDLVQTYEEVSEKRRL